MKSVQDDLFQPKVEAGDGFEQTVAAYGKAIMDARANPKFTDDDARGIVRAAMKVAVELEKQKK